ncbi:SDR family NAD(P)-dependent oxidoreductase [Sphingomonas sp. BIUV-7]|uniref:SDR family NAD(P)-dependent oxidoreductase n=1 Tax=Sphingomonas natans TaxID=3063330 RepID=A0ABT8Y8B7_9SPHN|nr:SDR family NAD(P)-dependent oxidoreductase [Sphingomonas sp. BIUV-7]MDO6414559.1 SDR family NAD(P)-dependent oxidoreductase [Sphingomonas sp. BIUV-7]
MDDAASLPERWINLSGKVALVTGAASGIGQAAALSLAGAGAIVLALDRDADGAQDVAKAIRREGGQADARALDVTSQAQWDETTRWVRETRGTIDILVNSAGVALSDRAGDTELDVYQRTFAINVEGSLLGMAAALEFMRAAGKGAIVNLSSTASLQGNPIMASYGASKAAISHFTRSAAKETMRAGHDIRINAVLPGLIETAMADDFHAIFDKVGPRDAFVKMITTGRAGRPEEVADLILYLVSDHASFISGACIVIDRAASA